MQNLYYKEDVSRMMPGKKDCVTILENGEKKKVQKRLVLGNLKEIYQQFLRLPTLKKSWILEIRNAATKRMCPSLGLVVHILYAFALYITT